MPQDIANLAPARKSNKPVLIQHSPMERGTTSTLYPLFQYSIAAFLSFLFISFIGHATCTAALIASSTQNSTDAFIIAGRKFWDFTQTAQGWVVLSAATLLNLLGQRCRKSKSSDINELGTGIVIFVIAFIIMLFSASTNEISQTFLSYVAR